MTNLAQGFSQPVAGGIPPGYVRMADGKLVPKVMNMGRNPPPSRKMLIVVSYYEGDKADAEDLLSLLAELERVKVKEADLMIAKRFDATEISNSLLQKLTEKFDKVSLHNSRRRDGTGHPFGCNQMFFDIVTMLGQMPVYTNAYYAFLNLEPDCVPTRPGWITELANAFKTSEAIHGKSALGFIHNDPVPHMNGVAVYAIDIWKRFPGDKLGGGNPQMSYDIEKAPFFLPVAEDSPLIYFEFKRPTITSDELFAPKRRGIAPALYHGVKDGSARAAVRARHISFTDKPAATRPNVFTYFQSIGAQMTSEDSSIITLWTEGWRSRGFNPVVLSRVDAMKHPHAQAFVAAVQKLPAVIVKERQMNRFMRWLALDANGGGLFADYDVLPARFNPELMGKPKGFHLARPTAGTTSIAMVYIDKPALAVWLDRMQNYDAQPEDLMEDRKNVTDLNVMATCAQEDKVQPEEWLAGYGEPGYRDAAAVHFAAAAIEKTSERATRKSDLMEKFLRGE